MFGRARSCSCGVNEREIAHFVGCLFSVDPSAIVNAAYLSANAGKSLVWIKIRCGTRSFDEVCDLYWRTRRCSEVGGSTREVGRVER